MMRAFPSVPCVVVQVHLRRSTEAAHFAHIMPTNAMGDIQDSHQSRGTTCWYTRGRTSRGGRATPRLFLPSRLRQDLNSAFLPGSSQRSRLSIWKQSGAAMYCTHEMIQPLDKLACRIPIFQ